jgi:hypothetical protein
VAHRCRAQKLHYRALLQRLVTRSFRSPARLAADRPRRSCLDYRIPALGSAAGLRAACRSQTARQPRCVRTHLSTVLRPNKAVAFLGIEPLHCSDRHFRPSRIGTTPPLRSEGWVTPPHRTHRGLALDRAWEAGRTMKKSTIGDVGIPGRVYKLWPSAGQQQMGLGRSTSEDVRSPQNAIRPSPTRSRPWSGGSGPPELGPDSLLD